MKLWLDAQISPHLAPWLTEQFGLEALSLRHLGLLAAKDLEVFEAARAESAVVMTKDADFVDLVWRRGAPPQVIWITFGNTSNAHLRELLREAIPRVLAILETGEAIVEVTERE